MNRSDETGSTALEALIAIAVIAVAAVAFVAGARGGLSALEKVGLAASDSSTLLRIDDALRNSASEIRIPYWSRALEVTTDGRSVSIPWYSGKADKTLSVSVSEESVTLNAGETTRTISGIRDARLAIARNAAGKAAALELNFKMREREVRILAPFGSVPLITGVSK